MGTTAMFKQWRAELLHVGDIVQDADESVSWEEREARFNRYVEMIEALTGTEGSEYVLAVMESVQAENDYGAYQSAQRAAWRFGDIFYFRALIHELPRLIDTLPEWAGEFLVSIANAQDTPDESTIRVFNDLLSNSDAATKQKIDDFIHQEEVSGWLRGRVGVLGSNA